MSENKKIKRKESNQPKVERDERYLDTFVRKTVYIEEGMLELIQDLASNRRGEQTRIINAALRSYLSNPDNIEKHAGSKDWFAKDYWKGLQIHSDEE
jgi:hypothetical protein